MSFTRGELLKIQAGVRPSAAMKVQTFDAGIESGKISSKASMSTSLTGADNDIDYLADTAGTAGNDITIEYLVDTQPGSDISVTESDGAIQVHLGSSATAVKAHGTMTSDATAPDTGGTFVLGSKTYTARTALTEAYASAVLTSDTTAPTDGDTVTIGATTYTFKDTLTASTTANEVLVGASAATALDNLKSAVNLTGTPGTDYGSDTVINAEATATTNTDTEQTFVAKTLGTAGNSIAKAENSTHLDFDGAGATFTGGVDAIANEVLIGASAAAFLDNVKLAVNAGAGAGTNYSTGTTANATAEATTNTNTTQKFEALTAGAAGNSIVLTENLTHTTVSGSGTLAEGSDAGEPSSSANEVITAIEAHTESAALVDVSLKSGNDGTGLVTTMSATNLSGGSDGKVPLFEVRGTVLVCLRGYCETDLTGNTATLVHGKTGTTNDLIPSFTATDLDAGEGIDSTGIVARGTALAKTPLKTYYDGQTIFATVGTASVTGGKIHYLADYVSLSDDASVEAV